MEDGSSVILIGRRPSLLSPTLMFTAVGLVQIYKCFSSSKAFLELSKILPFLLYL